MESVIKKCFYKKIKTELAMNVCVSNYVHGYGIVERAITHELRSGRVVCEFGFKDSDYTARFDPEQFLNITR
jgi:hypothetical protein